MATGTVVAAGRGMEAAMPVLGPLIGFFTLAATVLAWRAASHSRLDARTRSAWKWISVSFSLLMASIVLFIISGTNGYPASAVATKLAATLVLLIGLTRLPMRPLEREHRLRLFLDAGTVAAAASLFLWYLLVAPVIASNKGTTERLASAVAHPLLDVGLIFVMAVVLMRGVNCAVEHRAAVALGGAESTQDPDDLRVDTLLSWHKGEG